MESNSEFYEHLLRWSYFSPRYNLHYVSVPKAACTTIKWWFAELVGLSREALETARSLESDTELVIHDAFPQVAPRGITSFTKEELDPIIASENAFRFAVVRNPFKRVFSGWQSKLLLREPLQIARYREMDWFHHPIGSRGETAEAFEQFLEHLVKCETPDFWDPHWTLQTRMVRADLVRYDLVAQLEDASKLQDALKTRLGSDYKPLFADGHANESLLPFVPEFFTDRSVEIIRELYREDFETFGYPMELPTTRTEFSEAEFRVAAKAIGMLRRRNNRFGMMRDDFQKDIRSQRCALEKVEGEVSELRATIADIPELKRQKLECDQRVSNLSKQLALILSSRSWRMTQPLRSLSHIVGLAKSVDQP